MMRIVRATVFAAILAVPLSALVVSQNLFFPFITGKAIMFRTLVEIAFFAWVLLALFDRRYRPRDSSIAFVFAVFVAWMFVANAFAVNPQKAFFGNFERMEGWIMLLHLFLFFMVLGAMMRTQRSWKMFWFVSLGVSAVVSFYALGDMASASSGTRIGGTLGNPIYLAAYALFHIFIAAYYFFNGQVNSRAARFFLCAIAFAHGMVLFYSGTRSAMLGLFAGVSVAVVVIFAARYGIRRKTAVVVAAIVLFGVAIFFMARMPALREHPVFSRIASISLSGGKTRLTLWMMALEGARERPLFGWGQEGYSYVFASYYEPSLFGQEQWYDRAHNSYLEWLVAGGAPAFLLYCAIFWLVFRALWKYENGLAAASLLVGLVSAYAVHSVFVFDNVITSIMFVAVLAYAHSISVVEPLSPSRARESFFLRKYRGGAAVGAMLCCMIAFLGINAGPLVAGRELARAVSAHDIHDALDRFHRALSYGFGRQEIREQLALFSLQVSATPEIPEDARVETAHAAIAEMSQQVLETPNDVRTYVMRSIAYRAFPDAHNAWRDLEKARELSPRKQTLFLEQGTVAYFAGDKRTAANLFSQAYALDESFTETAAYAGAGLIATGKTAEGQAILQKHFGTVFPDHVFVRSVYEGK